MINAMAIHSASLCLDILGSEEFRNASVPDIENYYPDVLNMVKARIEDTPQPLVHVPGVYAERLSKRIVALLVECKTTGSYWPTSESVLVWLDDPM